MKPKEIPSHISLVWTDVDRKRIERLQKKLEVSRPTVLRMAVRLLAEKEGCA